MLIIDKLRFGDNIGLTNKPAFYIALTSMIMGTLFFLSGFVAELVVRNAADRNHYIVEEDTEGNAL
jgi:hypothetical protein